MPPACPRTRALSLASSLLLTAAVAAGCGDSEKHGELIVAIGTDMAMPQQIDNLFVQVQMRGLVVFDSTYAVGSGNQDSMIPATLSLVSGERRDPVTIRIAGQKRGKWRTYREATTTVPTDRSALLRMPVQWLCDETAKAVTFRDASGVTQIRMLSSCEDGNTCVAGKCRPSLIEATALSDYAAEDVFGGAKDPAQGECFDTIPCMAAGKVVEPDADCTIPKPDGEDINVALRVTNDGICDSTNGTTCFVPLDADPVEGWSPVPSSDRLQLPTAVCEKLKTRFVNAVYASSVCPTKRPAIPPCGAWSSVGKAQNQAGAGGVTGGTAGAGGAPSVSYPTAALVASLVRDANTSVCCPLMGDGGNVYTCLCTSKTNATLMSIDVASGRTMVVGSLNPPAERESVRFPAEVMQGALYWAANQQIQRTPIQGTGSIAGEFPVGGAIYERTTMLGGEGTVFALGTGFMNMPNAPVQVIALDPTMPVRTLDTGGTQPVFQFAQDDNALYIAVDVDKDADGGKKRRTSSVIRLAKADGARTTIIPEHTLEITDTGRGGFTGVQVDRTTLFALYEGMTASDGTVTIQVQRVDLTQQPPSPSVVYEAKIDRKLSLISMIGAIDGGLVLSRLEYASDDPTGVRSSSVIILPATQPGPIFAADYPKDYPGNDLVSDDSQIYWLNSSGKLYGFPRKALQ